MRSFTYQAIERSRFVIVDGGSESSKCHGHCDLCLEVGCLCGYITYYLLYGLAVVESE